MIDKDTLEGMLKDYGWHMRLRGEFEEWLDGNSHAEGARHVRKSLSKTAENSALEYERILCYVLSSGAECPTLEELRKAKEVQA